MHAADNQIDGIRIFAGIEVDILGDGTLDLSEEVLAQMDLVIASVHSRFQQGPQEMTYRLLRALEHPHVACSAILPAAFSCAAMLIVSIWKRCSKAAAQHNVAMELNAYPDRLDLCDRHLRMAREQRR